MKLKMYESFSDEPWSHLRRATVRVGYIGHDVPPEWLDKTSVTPQELRELCHGMDVSIEVITPNVYYDQEHLTIEVFDEDKFESVINLEILELDCKAGLILKSQFDITQFFFEYYNPMLLDEHDRAWNSFFFRSPSK